MKVTLKHPLTCLVCKLNPYTCPHAHKGDLELPDAPPGRMVMFVDNGCPHKAEHLEAAGGRYWEVSDGD